MRSPLRPFPTASLPPAPPPALAVVRASRLAVAALAAVRASRLAVAALAGALLLAGVPAAPASARVAPGFFAVNANMLRPGVLPAEARGRHLDLMRSGGLAAIRMDVLWNDVQPQPSPGPNYAAYDPVVADAARRGITVNPVLAYGTTWASSLGSDATPEQRRKSPPSDVALYVRYSGTLAQRYGRGGSFWRENPTLPYRPVTTYEIWNEPNSAPYWRPAPDPAGYADLLAAAATAIHTIDPDAVVVAGGLVSGHDRPWVMDPRDFVTTMLAARPDLRGIIGAVGLHSYAPTAAETMDDVDALRATLRGIGLDVPIALDEWGASTAGAGAVSDAARAALYADAMDLMAARSDLLYSAPYAWATDEADPANPESFFGMVPPEARPGVDPVPSATGRAFLDAVRAHQSGDAAPAPEPPAPPVAPAPPSPSPAWPATAEAPASGATTAVAPRPTAASRRAAAKRRARAAKRRARAARRRAAAHRSARAARRRAAAHRSARAARRPAGAHRRARAARRRAAAHRRAHAAHRRAAAHRRVARRGSPSPE